VLGCNQNQNCPKAFLIRYPLSIKPVNKASTADVEMEAFDAFDSSKSFLFRFMLALFLTMLIFSA
jgi:hypothetical protein